MNNIENVLLDLLNDKTETIIGSIQKESWSIFEDIISNKIAISAFTKLDPRDAFCNYQEILYKLGRQNISQIIGKMLHEISIPENDRKYCYIGTIILSSENDSESLNILYKLFSATKEKYSKAHILEAIGKLFQLNVLSEESIEIVIKSICDRSSFVRSTAIDIIAQLKDIRSIPNLKLRISDRYPGIRDAAAKLLTELESKIRPTTAST